MPPPNPATLILNSDDTRGSRRPVHDAESLPAQAISAEVLLETRLPYLSDAQRRVVLKTTALASGVYGVAGFSFVYAIGYLLPSPWLAVVAGALVFAVEVLALSWIGRALGWVERRADPNDRRARTLYVTSGATPVLEQIDKLSAQMRTDALAGLNAEQRNQLMTLLEHVYQNLLPTKAEPAAAAKPAALPMRKKAQ